MGVLVIHKLKALLNELTKISHKWLVFGCVITIQHNGALVRIQYIIDACTKELLLHIGFPLQIDIILGIHIICQAKNLRMHDTLKKTPYSLMFGQFNRVPILDLPFDRNLLLELKTETDLERLLKSDTVWTDPASGVSATPLVDLTVEDEDEVQNIENEDNEPPFQDSVFDPDEPVYHDSYRDDDNFYPDQDNTDTIDSNAGGFFRDENNTDTRDSNTQSIPMSLSSQPLSQGSPCKGIRIFARYLFLC